MLEKGRSRVVVSCDSRLPTAENIKAHAKR
jgi:hypothetical protein